MSGVLRVDRLDAEVLTETVGITGAATVDRLDAEVMLRRSGPIQVDRLDVEVLSTTTGFPGVLKVDRLDAEVMLAISAPPVVVEGGLAELAMGVAPGDMETAQDGGTAEISYAVSPGSLEVSLGGVLAGMTFQVIPGDVAWVTEIPGGLAEVNLLVIPGDAGVTEIAIEGATSEMAFLAVPGDFTISAFVTIMRDLVTTHVGEELTNDTVENDPIQDVIYEEWTMLKGTARRIVHDVFAITAIYLSSVPGSVGKAIRVRWHPQGSRLGGDLQGRGYAEVLLTVDRMIFNMEQLAEVGIILKRGDRITLPDYNDLTFLLDVRDEKDGPVTNTWEVMRQ
jgi:hypothetical protein